jgi:hypothetical protein
MEHKILPSYKRDSDSELITTIYRVLGKMEGNSNFPNPPAALAAAKKELPEFITSLTDASGGDTLKTERKNIKKAGMIILLSELADYATLTCKGDRAMLLSSGFRLNRTKGETSLEHIKELQVTIGPPGQAITKVKRVTGARAYIHQYTIDPLTGESEWTSKFITDTNFVFNGLQSKEKYLFRVIAIGLKGQEVISPVVARVIQ